LDESVHRRADVVHAHHLNPIIDPERQYHDGARTQYPETHAMKRLMLAVLEDALHYLQTYAESRNPAHRQGFGEAEAWILDRRAKGPFAFVSICEALGIQPDHLREGIRQWRLQLSDGRDSRRLQRRSVRRSEPSASLVRRRFSHSGPSRTDAWTAGLSYR
jgi:hypothetical protein